MTKEFLGNIRAHRGQKKKTSVWRLCFLSSCSSHLPLLAHQQFSDVSNSPLTCVSFSFFFLSLFCPECRAKGRARKFFKLVVIQRVEDGSLCWQDPALQGRGSISLVGFELTLGVAH